MEKIKLGLVVVCVAVVGCGDSGDYGRSDYDASTSHADTSPSEPYPPGSPDMSAPPQAGAPDLEESRDRFEHVGTNPFVVVGHDPFSTFAADVDTASYDIFARDIEAGLLPHPASVRLEEYVNFFDYDYPTPETGAEVPFSIDLAASRHAMGRDLAQLRVGIQASAPPHFVQLPTNLVFLVDVSGSMRDPDKLPYAKILIEASLDVLSGIDTVSIVTYSGTNRIALAPTRATERDEIMRVVGGLRAYGSTGGGDAIHRAYEHAEDGYIDGGFNHVVMMTDGDFNVGITSNDALVELIEEKRRSGVTLTALGFGRGNLNDAMMERVSNAGNGTYSVITSADHAREYADGPLLAGVHLVAQDMKIQVEFNPEHVVAYRLLGYENRAVADSDFRVDSVDAGEVGAGRQVTAVYEVVLTGQEIPTIEGAPAALDGDPVAGDREIDAGELVQVRVRWKDLGASEVDPAHETVASLAAADIAEMIAGADPNLSWAAAVAAFAEVVKGSPYASEADLPLIAEIVAEQAGSDEERLRFLDLFDRARGMFAP